jgi:hypothetical protein
MLLFALRADIFLPEERLLRFESQATSTFSTLQTSLLSNAEYYYENGESRIA